MRCTRCTGSDTGSRSGDGNDLDGYVDVDLEDVPEYYLFPLVALPMAAPVVPPVRKDRFAAPSVQKAEVTPTTGPLRKELHKLANVLMPPVAAEVVVETPPILLSDPPIRPMAAMFLLNVGTVRLLDLPMARETRLNTPFN